MEKQCFKCGCVKPLSMFYTHARMADGHLNKCKDCAKTDALLHRQGPKRSEILAYDRMRSANPKRYAERVKRSIEWRKLHPERRAAQIKLGNAVRDGAVIPWPVCAVPTCNDKPEAHHPDYCAPLAVSWLCAAHHRQAHALVATLKPSDGT